MLLFASFNLFGRVISIKTCKMALIMIIKHVSGSTATLTKMARTFSHIRACISHVHLHRHIVCANSACGHTRTHNVSANDACNSVLLEHYTHSHAYSHAYRIACGACICMRCTQYSARITACTRCIAHALILTPCKWKKNIHTIIMNYSSYYLSIWPWYQPISLLQ